MSRFTQVFATFLLSAFVVKQPVAHAVSGVDVLEAQQQQGLAYLHAWTKCSKCQKPVSVYYDLDSNSVFIANLDNETVKEKQEGWIQRLSAGGSLISEKWFSGLKSPKGMRSHNGILWVADDDSVVGIDIATVQIVKRYNLPDAKMIHDIAINVWGVIYASDPVGNKIFKIEKGQVSTFAQGSFLAAPKGLLIHGRRLIVASGGRTISGISQKGRLYGLDLSSRKQEFITQEGLGNLNSVEIDHFGDYLVADSDGGKIYKINKFGAKQVLFYGIRHLTDFAFIANRRIIVLPQSDDNLVTAFELSRYPNY